jgi:hypothetical protein
VHHRLRLAAQRRLLGRFAHPDIQRRGDQGLRHPPGRQTLQQRHRPAAHGTLHPQRDEPERHPGQQRARKWTDKNPNDYLSRGCIKMHPEEIKKLFRLLDRIGWPKSLKVVS